MERQRARQSSYKNWGDFLKFEERQKRFLNQQRTEREAVVALLRKSAIDSWTSETPYNENESQGVSGVSQMGDDMAGEEKCKRNHQNTDSKPRGRKVQTHRRAVARDLLNPDAMICVPNALRDEWCVYLRPEGNHVVVVTQGETTVILSKHGRESFRVQNEDLPHGLTILDAVLCDGECNPVHEVPANYPHDSNHVHSTFCLFVIDCICWNDMIMVDTPAECRHFFLKSRMQEVSLQTSNSTDVCDNGRNMFRHVSWYDVTTPNLQFLYNNDFEYQKDGLVFVHKEAFYIPGTNPLYLRFRDPYCSKWCVATADIERKNFPEFQTCYLRLNDQHELQTEDGYIVSQLTEQELAESPKKPRTLARVNVQNVELNGDIAKFQIRVVAWVNQRGRRTADTMSRIIEQHTNRFGWQKISFHDILQVTS